MLNIAEHLIGTGGVAADATAAAAGLLLVPPISRPIGLRPLPPLIITGPLLILLPSVQSA